MYWEYVVETIAYYMFRIMVSLACCVYVVDTLRKWTRRSK